MWETLIFGTGDWFGFGEPFFCGLFTPTNPLPGHRLVPESHSQYTQLLRAPIFGKRAGYPDMLAVVLIPQSTSILVLKERFARE